MRACEQKHTHDASELYESVNVHREMQNSDPAAVNRLVRMVCVFLSSLIRSKRIDKMVRKLICE